MEDVVRINFSGCGLKREFIRVWVEKNKQIKKTRKQTIKEEKLRNGQTKV